jgi:hydroxypyruvate reductase
MKPTVLQLSPILIPSVSQKLNELYEVHKYFEIDDKDLFLAKHAADVQGVVSGGHTGISKALMEKLPNLKVVAVFMSLQPLVH